jgi:UDP-3-O-[3-hydroxymyristoyl] glucosamine N-acyltransferase
MQSPAHSEVRAHEQTDAHSGSHPAHANGAARGWTTGQLARLLEAELVGPSNIRIDRLSAIDHADRESVTFVRDAKRAAQWPSSRASAAIVTRGVEVEPGDGRALLIVDDADRATITVLETLTPVTHTPRQGVHPSAVIDPTARVDPTAAIGPFVVVGPRTIVGARTVLHPSVSLGADVRVGPDCELRSGVVVEDRCTLGAKVRLHANVVIGADGFGYRPNADGTALIKIPHAGNVEIGDDVEIGANTTVDRGKFGPTTIGSGAKIDNLVQIGHNCQIGRSVIICGAAALAGSVTVGDGAILGGRTGVADNLSIGAGAKIGGGAGIMSSIPAGETWAGYPARPIGETMRIVSVTAKLPELMKQVKRLVRESREE